MFNIVYAMGQSGATPEQGAGGGMFIPIIIMFVIFYFLLIRPQQKQAKERREMINNLKKGDRIITTGGIIGKITSLDESRASLEIADKIRIKVLRSNIAGLDQPKQKETVKKVEEKTKKDSMKGKNN